MITFRDFDFDSRADCEFQARWDNDRSIRHLSYHCKDAAEAARVLTPEDIAAGKPKDPTHRRWMILEDGAPVGEMGFSLDDGQLVTKAPGTAWIGILIGEASARGRGVGERAMAYLEERAREVGAQRIELGVFEFNEVAIRFYQKLGYREVARLPEYAYWNGRMWTDIRMLKELTRIRG